MKCLKDRLAKLEQTHRQCASLHPYVCYSAGHTGKYEKRRRLFTCHLPGLLISAFFSFWGIPSSGSLSCELCQQRLVAYFRLRKTCSL